MFSYHASVLGLGGMMNVAGDPVAIPSQASVVLAPTGGEGYAEVKDFDQCDVYARKIQTSVTGSLENGVHTTRSEVKIFDLDVLGLVQIASMSAVMVSTREEPTPHDPVIDSTFTLNASIVGLTVNGENVAPILDTSVFLQFKEFNQFLKHVASDAHRPVFAERFGWDPAEAMDIKQLADEVGSAPAAAGTMPTKLQKPIRASFLNGLAAGVPPGLARKGYKLEVPSVGHLFLGEVLLKPGRRRINMLRFDLDRRFTLGERPDSAGRSAGADGTLTIASVEGNGVPTYP